MIPILPFQPVHRPVGRIRAQVEELSLHHERRAARRTRLWRLVKFLTLALGLLYLCR